MAIQIYRLLESIDGEKGFKLMPYKWAERIKLICLKFIK